MNIRLFTFVLFLAVLLAPVISAQENTAALTIYDANGKLLDEPAWQQYLAAKRVVYIGESHDRYDHHLNQLAIIRALHQASEKSPKSWAIGLEMFQRHSQPALDAYSAGELDDEGLLDHSRYYETWGYDYRLYRPILQYAKARGIPLVALNLASGISRRIAEVGLAGLSPDERSQVPDFVDKSDNAYREHIKAVYAEHSGEEADFEKFWEAQLAWDETMAASAAEYLKQNPDKSMLIIAGSGHLANRSGIPQRLQRRIPLDSALVLQFEIEKSDSMASVMENRNGADLLLLSEPQTLPAPGRMGIMLGLEEGVRAEQVIADSAAAKAGMLDADRIISIDSRAVRTLGDVRIALLDKKPGDRIDVEAQRDGKSMTFVLTLQ